MTVERAGRGVNFIHARLASWPPKGRSVVGTTVLDEDGSPTDDKDAVVALKSHWEPVFNNVVGDRRAFNSFPGLFRSALRGLSPWDGRSFVLFVVFRGGPLLDLTGLGTWPGGLEVRMLLILFMIATSRFLMVARFLVGLGPP